MKKDAGRIPTPRGGMRYGFAADASRQAGKRKTAGPFFTDVPIADTADRVRAAGLPAGLNRSRSGQR